MRTTPFLKFINKLREKRASKTIEAERDAAAKQLQAFMRELGDE